jgi:HEPN domain-containing protein
LAIEKCAKAIISCFEAYEWSHDPSEQLRKVIGKGLLNEAFLEVASYAEEAAPWHGASTYGERKDGRRRSPSDVCTEQVAQALLIKARKAIRQASEFIEDFYKQ